MEIRNIEKADLVGCAEVLCKAFSGPPWGDGWELAVALERLEHFFASCGFVGVCAERDDRIVGFVLGNQEPFYFGPIFYLREMCVEPQYQRNGIGANLLQDLQQTLLTLDVVSVYLMTEKSIGAAKFYQGLGFQPNAEVGFFAKKIGDSA